MADPIAARLTSSTVVSDNARPASLVASASLVIAFWWAATGLTLAMQLSEFARTTTVIATALLAVFGAFLVATSRNDLTPRGARCAFFGAAMIWWWCAAIFYAGWGSDLTRADHASAWTLQLAFEAIAATWRVDAIAVFALIAIGVAVHNRVNRLAFWSYAAFWGTLQTAKLNVFFGVRNSGVELLPQRLAGLGAFFGPPRNSVALPITVAALATIAILLAQRARRAPDRADRHAFVILAMLVGLAVVEHVMLGVSIELPLWNAFLQRGS